jgi:predicted alpha/beta superfamily hydrolase
MDSLRNRDYTFPMAGERDSFRISGWGDKYYDFIASKIKPFIDSLYRTDDSSQTIVGHSLAGYFALYSFSRSSNAHCSITLWQQVLRCITTTTGS